ncbi:MAG: alpha-amylase family glycosyl hydrolase [Simkaniaceae bacterium]|nr:alpha-amylase family glycosyl hydrolase [Simkaniaceae bacterium]
MSDGRATLKFFSNAEKVDLYTPEGTLQMQQANGIWSVDHKPPFDYAFKIEGSLYPDPYGFDLNTPTKWGAPREQLLSRYAPTPQFDWEGFHHCKHERKDLIIYEMHVRSFTQDPSARVKNPGTFKGVIEKIDHLKNLGITAVELMPIFEFDETDHNNYWGYSPISFFTPMRRYGTKADFQEMVKRLHMADISVILDVVYNHVGNFPIYDREEYFLTGPNGEHTNYSGCGNTLACNKPRMGQLILDSMHYWSHEMGVDGFRFDLASILTRGKSPWVIKAMDDSLHLIAEPWDAAGLYQVGSFPGGENWMEWNGKFRDTVRRYIRGEPGCDRFFQDAMEGSPSLYSSPLKSVNFITAHDGFSLRDLVSYNQKHNEKNGENNCDGSNENYSDNCGFEGESEDPKILSKRNQRMKKFIDALFQAKGIPMLTMGDEYGHSRQGNNNPWCQDNELNWFNWDHLEQNQELFEFVRTSIKNKKTLC